MNQQDKKIAEAFGIPGMSEAEQQALFTQSGDILVDASVGRLLTELPEGEVEDLEQALTNLPTDTDVVAYLLETYPRFATIIQEEVAALRAEAAAVVPPSEEEA